MFIESHFYGYPTCLVFAHVVWWLQALVLLRSYDRMLVVVVSLSVAHRVLVLVWALRGLLLLLLLVVLLSLESTVLVHLIVLLHNLMRLNRVSRYRLLAMKNLYQR